MSTSGPIAYVEMRVSAHATEDADRVLVAVRNLLPIEFVDVVTFKKSVLHGHFGNPIVLFEAKVKDRKVAKAIFEKLANGLSVPDKTVLADDVKRHLDDGNLYLRLDKQSAFSGECRLGMVDPVRFKFHFRKHTPEDVVDICRKYGLLP